MNLPILRLALATATLCSMGLTGCTLSTTATSTPLTSTVGHIRGKAFGGNQPISNANVYVYAAGTSGYGGASTLLSPSPAVTAADGSFSVTTDYVCTSGQQIYLYALGGNTGSGTNDNSGMLAILGQCPSTGGSMASVTPFVWMNEVTTVAAAYAFSGFATDATHVSDDEGVVTNTTATLAQTGMANAFGNAANLANLATGTALTTTGSAPTGTIVVPQAQINTIADVLAACVNTPSTISSPSSACSTLLSTATSDGTATGVQPTDTATAAINIAHNPTANVATLYGLIAGQGAAFVPDDPAQPADFTVSIEFPQGGTGTVGMAADGLGNVFATYGGGSLVYKITPAAVETSIGTGGQGQPRHLAVDASNNVWVPLVNSGSTTGTIVEYSNDLVVSQACNALDTTVTPNVSAVSLNSIAIAQNGNIWATGAKSSTAGNAIEVTPSCTPVTSIAGLPQNVTDIAINPSGFIAIPSSSANNLSIFSSTGAPVANSPFTGGGLLKPEGVITDFTGNFWVTDNAGTVSVLTAAGAPVATNGYATGGTLLLSGDFDGLGNYFTGSTVTTGTTQGIYELKSSGTPVTTYAGLTNTLDYVAFDPSGNLWYGGNKIIAEMIGVAAPKVTPIVTATFDGKLNTRP